MTRSFIPPANPQIQTRAIAHDHADQASLTVPDADLLFSADFKRSGSDLTLIGPNGQKYIIFDYFRFEKRPDLISSDGAVLSAKIVEALAAANTPTQYAQATAPAPSAQIIGKVEKVAGSVTAVRNGVAVTLNVGDALNKSDIVQTGSDSTCGISLLDGTALNLSANTRMALIEFIFDANASSGNASHLTLIQGAFAFVSGLVAPTGGLNIETPVANIGIRGTVGVAVCSVGGNCDFSAGNEVSRDKIGQPSTFELMTGGHYENGRYVDGTVIGTVTVGSTLSVAPAGPGNPPQITFVPAQAADPGLTSLLQQVIQFYPQVFVPPAPPGLQQQQQQQQPQQDQQQQQQNPNPQSGPSGSPQLPPTPPLQQNDHPENLQPLAAITNPPQTFVATVPPEQTAATTTTTAVADAIILSFEPPPPVAVANPIATQSSNEDGTWDFVVPPDTFSGLNNATLTLAASMVDGSPLPNWLSFDAPTATFHGTTPQNANGSVQLQVVATDGQSSIADLFTLNVVPVNDAPIVVNGDVSLPTINENTGNPAGATLATLLNGHFSDQADEVPDGSHANLLAGIAIYSNPANPAGVWEWSVDGTTWNSIATDLSDSHALVLDTSTKIRFVPSAGFHGEAPALLARLIDDSSGSVTNGTFVDLLASGVGDSTPYSADPLNIGEAVNDAPIIDNVGGTVFVAEDVVALLQAPPAAVVTDTDGDTLTMTVSVAHGTLSLGQAVLDAITAGTLTGLDGDGSDGNLSVSGSAAAITAAIQAGITYTADANYNGPDTLGVEITDGLATTNASVAITVTPANDAPTVANAIADQNATQGNAFLFQFASNTFNDVDGDALSYTATLDSGAALPGWLHFDGSTRTFSGTPTNADVGTIAVKVTASDGSAPVSDTFNITVGNTNDAPQGADNTVTTLEDTPRTLTAADFGFSDPNDTPANTLLAVKITTLPAVGTLSNNNVAVSAGQFISIAEINAGLLKFMPAANANGTGYASFTFQVQDNGGGIDLDPTPNTITVDVTPVNDAPTVANAITDQNATQGNLFSFQFAPNAFNDVDGDTLAYTATLDSGAALPSWLSFDAGSRTFSGTPGAGDIGTIAVKVTASDGSLPVSDTFNITVGNTNDAPVIQNVAGPVTVAEDTSLLLQAPTALVTDADSDTLTMTVSVAGGTLTPSQAILDAIFVNHTLTGIDTNGSDGNLKVAGSAAAITAAIQAGVTYTPDANIHGLDSLDVAISDGQATTFASVSINVTSVNDAPTVANAITDQNATQGNLFSFQFAPNAFNDVDGDTLAYTATLDSGAALPSWLSFDAGSRTFSGTPGAGDIGTIAVKVTASDGSLPVSDTFNITVGNTNDAPVLNATATPVLTAENEDAGTPVGAVGTLVSSLVNLNPPPGGLDNVTDADSGALTGIALTAINSTNGTWFYSTNNGGTWTAVGSVTDNSALLLSADGSTRLYFQPNADFNGTVSNAITFRAWDQSSGAAGSKVDATTNGGSTAFSAATDTADLIINAVNDAPNTAAGSGSGNEDTTIAASLSGSDIDGSVASFKITSLPVNGTLYADAGLTDTLLVGETVTATGNAATVFFRPNLNYNGSDSFTYAAVDNNGALDATPATASITVTLVNDAPTVANAIADQNATQGNAFSFQFAANTFNDVDGDTLVYTATLDSGAALPAWLTFNAALRTFSGTPGAGDVGTIAVKVTASDGNLPVSDTFNIAVGNTNDAPAGTDKTVTTLEDTAHTFTAADFGFSDPNDTPANTLQGIKIATLPAAGTLTNNGAAVTPGQFISIADINAGLLKFTPAANASGNGYASFTFQVQDDGGTANGGVDTDPSANTITINVTPVDDAPSGTDKTVTTAEDTAYTFTVDDFGFSDVDGNTLLAVKITTLPGVGTLTDNGVAVALGQFISIADINAGLLKFTPAANANGNGYAGFTFQVQDDDGGLDLDPTPNTITVDVTPVNDAPIVLPVETLTRVSVPQDVLSDLVPGTDPLATHAIAPDINGEGRFVVFFSSESVPGQGDNGDLKTGDVFLFDRLTQETKILTDAAHIPLGLRENGERFSGFAISGDGHFVVFTGDYTVSDQFGQHDVSKVYIYDRELDQVTLLTDKFTHATITVDDMPQTNGNGALIALIRHDNTGLEHVSVYSRDGSLLTDITTGHADIPDTLDRFQNVAISNDGRYITFWGYEQDSNFQPTGLATLFRFDRTTNSASIVGTTTAGEDLWTASLSRDGQKVVFQTDQSLVSGDTNGKIDIYVYDSGTNTTTRVSTDGLGTLADGDSIRPSISPDGRFVTFASNATNLVPGDTNGQPDTFVKDLQTGAIERVSVAVDGTQGNGDSSLGSSIAGGGTGTFVAFGSAASNLAPGDGNAAADIFVLDRSGGTAGQVVEDSSVSPAGTLSTQGSLAFVDVELTDSHTPIVTAVDVSVTGGAPASLIVPGGLGTFIPTIVENPNDADPFGQLSWSFTIDNAALALLNSGQRVLQTYKVEIDDGHGGIAIQNIDITLIGITDQPTLTIEVLTPDGMFAQTDEPIGQMGSGDVQPGGMPTQFTIVNLSANRKFVFEGYGFQFNGSNPTDPDAPTAGLITGIHELTNDTSTPLVNYSGIGVAATDWYSAVVAAAGGSDAQFNNLTSGWAFNFVGDGGADSFIAGDQVDTMSGGGGDDFLLGAAGNDSISGGDGNDTLAGGAGNDQLNGGGGQDLAIYFHPTEGDANAIGPVKVQLASGTVTTYIGSVGGTVDSVDTLRSIERVMGTLFNDQFDATSFGVGSLNAGSIGVGASSDGSLNEFEGLGGDDVITGNGNTRVAYLNAMAGVTVSFSTFGVGTAHSTVSNLAGIGNDTFLSGVNRVRGSNFADNFTGSNNPGGTAEFFDGRGGDDFIDGGGGLDAAVYGNETAGINVQLAAGTAAVGPATQTDTLRSIEWISGTDFVDVFNASGFTTTPSNGPNFGSAGVNGLGQAFNRFEGRGGDDTITGNGNTQIGFDNALAGVTVTFTSLGAGTSHGTAAGDLAGVGTDTFTGVIGVRGSGFDDVIGPDGGNNIIDGRGGNDTFQGGAGNDSLTGGGGIDRAIYTDAGPDGISVDMAAGTVSGTGIGTDTLSSVESIRGSAFADSYNAVGYLGASASGSIPPNLNEFEGMAGDDTITGNGGTVVSYLNATAGVTVIFTSWTPGQGASGTATGDLSVGTDTFTGVQFARGSAYDDILTGSDNFSGVEVFEGRGGDDLIDGRGGFDRVIYEFRLDVITTSGLDINLAAGTITGDASTGTDTLLSIEAVRGTRFDDNFDATGFTDSSTNAGSAGVNNTGAAFNEFEGQAGDDTIIGNGNTRISYINAASGVTVDLAFGTATGDSSVGHDTIVGGVNAIIGSNFADTLYGTDNFIQFTGETFDGADGNDIIVGRGGFDMAVYNADTGTASGINVNMASGIVVGDASIGTDTLSSIESIRGTNFADTYNATGFNGASDDLVLPTTFNEFEGMAGNDTITGNGDTRISYVSASGGVTVDLVAGTAHGNGSVGDDTITGGVSRVRGSNFNDTLTGNANSILEGGPGADALSGPSGGSVTAVYDHASSGITVDLTTTIGSSGDALGDTFNFISNIRGSSFNDFISGDGADNTLDGGFGGNDQLTGRGGVDTFVFRSGHLTITDFNTGGVELIDIRTLDGGAHISDTELSALIAGSTGDQLDLGNGNIIQLTGIDVHTQLSTSNFIHS